MALAIALVPGDRLRMAKRADRTDRFCRPSLQVLAANPQLIPPDFDFNDSWPSAGCPGLPACAVRGFGIA